MIMTKDKKQMLLHFAASTIGGFMGGYAIFNHCDIFGNAQTANLIHLVQKILSADLSGIFFLSLCALTYICGIVFSVVAEKKIKIDIKLVSFLVTLCAIVVIGVFPNVSNNYLAILPILFSMPVQWHAFATAGGYVSATVFSSNNLKQAVSSLALYITEKDKAQARKAKFFWLTLASFHSGVALACVTGMFLNVYSIWFCLLPLALTFGVYAYVNADKLKVKRATY